MWTIRQMSELAGLPVDSLRYYDKLGIVSPKRGDNGYRYYGERDYILLQYIVTMKYARFSLGEIKQIICSFDMERNDECNRLNYMLLESKREELTERIRSYRKIIKLIDRVLPMVDGADAFYDNEKEVDAFVRDVYKSIRNQIKTEGEQSC
jgi:MerR family Zn(II)-responsive transcriptional regulator of zntA